MSQIRIYYLKMAASDAAICHSPSTIVKSCFSTRTKAWSMLYSQISFLIREPSLLPAGAEISISRIRKLKHFLKIIYQYVRNLETLKATPALSIRGRTRYFYPLEIVIAGGKKLEKMIFFGVKS